MPNGGHTITSVRSGAGNIENRGARKVILWSRHGWHDIDSIGSERLPEGRFVRACTVVNDQEWDDCRNVHPVSRVSQQSGAMGTRQKNAIGRVPVSIWMGCGKTSCLKRDISGGTVLLGDFNLQIPAKKLSLPTF